MCAVALGYLGDSNDAILTRLPVEITGVTLGSALDLGCHLNITKSIVIGAQLSIAGGALSKLNFASGGLSSTQTFDKDQKESLSRLDCSLAARFNF